MLSQFLSQVFTLLPSVEEPKGFPMDLWVSEGIWKEAPSRLVTTTLIIYLKQNSKPYISTTKQAISSLLV